MAEALKSIDLGIAAATAEHQACLSESSQSPPSTDSQDSLLSQFMTHLEAFLVQAPLHHEPKHNATIH